MVKGNPSPEKILAGIPRIRVSNQFADSTQQFFCGLWTSTAGKWRVRYTEYEFCVLIEGRVRLESIHGEKHEMRAKLAGERPHRLIAGAGGDTQPAIALPARFRQ